MSPEKKKAIELVERFKPHSHFWVHDLVPQKQMDEEQMANAQECAVICCEEVIMMLESYGGLCDVKEDLEDWQKLKEEIEKL